MDADHSSAQHLLNAANGFDYLFSNNIDCARTHFQSHDDPFSLMGTGICAFLEAALGMEVRNKTLDLVTLKRCCVIDESHGRSDTLP